MNYFLFLATLWALFAMIAVSIASMAETTTDICLSASGWFGAGAYLSALLTIRAGFGITTSILASALILLPAGYCVGLLLSGLYGEHFALASFGISIILFDVLNNATQITRGGYGLFAIPVFSGGIGAAFITSVTLLGLLLLLLLFIKKHAIWKLLIAIGDDIALVDLLGKNVKLAKGSLYGIVAIICVIAGGLYSHTSSFLDPAFFRPVLAVYFAAMIAIGPTGARSAMLGAAIFVGLPEIIDAAIGIGSRVGYLRQLIFGGALIFGALLPRRKLPPLSLTDQ